MFAPRSRCSFPCSEFIDVTHSAEDFAVEDDGTVDTAFITKLKSVSVQPSLLAVPALPRPNPHNAEKLRERLTAPSLSRPCLAHLPAAYAHVTAALTHNRFDARGKAMVVQFETRA